MPIQVTTDLPDVSSIDSLDNGVEDEVTVNWPDAINYGDYHVSYRETGASAWLDAGVVGETATSATVTGLDDGTEYEFRVRSETEHVNGSWTPGASIITTFPSPDSLTPGSPTQTSIDLTWSEYSDAEDGFRVWRAREYDSGWGSWEDVADLAPNTTSHTDDTVSPGNTYKYYVEAYTTDASGQTGESSAVTTTSSGRPRGRTGASGWTVKVEHPSGQTLRPQLLDDPQYTPALKDFPRVEIPVARDEKWQAPAFENATVSVWKDGRILPIEELVDVRLEPGRTVLEARGGAALADRVQAEYDNTEAHVAAQELGQTHTPYTMNVDDPASETRSSTEMQSADATSKFTKHLADPITADDPITLENGQLKLQQTCFFSEGEDWDRTSNASTAGYDDSSGGTRGRIGDTGAYIEYDFNIDHVIPGDDVGAAFRATAPNDPPAMRWYVNDNRIDYLTTTATGIGSGIDWDHKNDAQGTSGSDTYNGSGYDGPDLRPEDNPHTVRIEVTDGETDNFVFYDLDCLALYDQGGRFGGFSYNWAETIQSDGYLNGPELYPAAYTVEFADATTAFNVTAGEIALTIDDTSNGQAVALSNDQGGTWAEAANQASLQTSFDGAGSTLRFRVTLSRYGSQNATPRTGVHGQQVDAYTLSADLEDTPVLNGQSYDGQLIDVLNRIADYGNFIWELQRDSSGWSIEWTRPGQRTSDRAAGLVDYTVTKSVEHAYEKAVVKGAATPVRGETFPANYDNWEPLNRARLVPATHIVRDPSSGTTYTMGAGDDYVLDRQDGRIKVNSGGRMDDGATYEIDYHYKTQGAYEAPDAGSSPDTLVRTVASLTTNTDCQNAALYLVQRLQDPVWEATVTIPKAEAGRSLVDDLLLEDLPTDGTRMEIRELRQTPRKVTMELGSRKSIGDLVEDLNSRVDSVADRV